MQESKYSDEKKNNFQYVVLFVLLFKLKIKTNRAVNQF